MKKLVFLIYFFLFGIIIVHSQTLNSNETAKLKLFLAQESDESGKKNYQQLGIQNLETVDWKKVTGLSWNANGRLDSINWYMKKLGGNLDVSGFAELDFIYCESNGITSIDVTGCVDLFYFWCLRNNLTSIDISTNKNLESFCCRYQANGALKELNLTNNPKLWYFCGSGNQFEHIDISKNTELETFSCRLNKLKSIDVSNNKKLNRLFLRENQLTELVLTNHSDLNYLECFGNQLTTLDVSGCPNLKRLEAYNNRLKEIKIGLLDMDILMCEDNAMTFSTLPKLKSCTDFVYAPQQDITLAVSSNVADLSSEYSIDGKISEFAWSTNPSESKEGIFTFQSSLKTVTCSVKNTSFPALTLKYNITLNSSQSIDTPNDIDIYANNSLLYLKTNQPLTATIYTTSGALVNQLAITESETVIPLPAGIYLIKLSNGLVRRVIIR
jgi:hypothetical protein